MLVTLFLLISGIPAPKPRELLLALSTRSFWRQGIAIMSVCVCLLKIWRYIHSSFKSQEALIKL